MNVACTSIDALSVAGLHERMLRLRCALVESVSLEDMAAVFKKLVDRAAEGCFQSMKLLLGYVLGRPGPITQLPAPAPAAGTVTNRVQTATVPPASAPLVSAELERRFHETVTSGGLDDARHVSVLGKPARDKR